MLYTPAPGYANDVTCFIVVKQTNSLYYSSDQHPLLYAAELLPILYTDVFITFYNPDYRLTVGSRCCVDLYVLLHITYEPQLYKIYDEYKSRLMRALFLMAGAKMVK